MADSFALSFEAEAKKAYEKPYSRGVLFSSAEGFGVVASPLTKKLRRQYAPSHELLPIQGGDPLGNQYFI